MALRTLIGSLCGIAWLAGCPVASASLVSTFDAGDEGWSANSSQGTGGVDGFAWSASGGNPGGGVQARDIGSEGGWWFVAPAAWSGDWTGYLGGTISFDVFATRGTSTTPNPPVEAVVLALDDGGRLRAKQGAGAQQDQWTSVEIELDAASFTLTSSQYTFEQALAHVTAFVIPGDFVYQQQDVTRLDNVRVRAAPEPSTWTLALGGLAAALWARRLQQRSAEPRRDETTPLAEVS